jgi:hypothetical protein
MRASRVLATTGIIVVAAASGVAFAQKSIPAQPVAPISVPALPNPVFKSLKPLTNQQKLTLVKPAKGATPTERDLDAPTRLSVRTPYIDANHYLEAYGAVGYSPVFDPPQLHLRDPSSSTFASLHFRAEPERTYLVDCPVTGNGGGTTGRYSTEVWSPSTVTGVAGPTTTTSVEPPPDGHLTLVVRKDAAVREMTVRLRWSGSNWYLGTCEITPIRGL